MQAKRDQNRVTTLLAVSNVDGETPVTLYADPDTHALLTDATTVPASPDMSVQFNDGGVFGGDAGFTYNKTTDTLSVPNLIGTLSDGLELTTPSGEAGTQDIRITAGNRTTSDGEGGDIFITSGDGFSSGSGGDIDIFSGSGGDTGNGGDVDIAANSGGATSGSGGSISLTAGSAQDGDSAGGQVNISAGSGFGAEPGGLIQLNAGSAQETGQGGGIEFSAGEGGATGGNGGGVVIQSGQANGGDGDGGSISIEAGPGEGSGSGGGISLSAGDAGATGNGANFQINGGSGGSSSGSGGDLELSAGDAGEGSTDSNGGNTIIRAGIETGSGTRGKIKLLNYFVGVAAILDLDTLSSSDKTFTFPNATGTFALQTAASGSFTTADAKTVTVVNGIITSIV